MADKLSQEATAALAAGMSYGKWKAMQPTVKPKVTKIPEGWIVCQWCGKPFKPSHAQRYCSQPCRHQATKKRTRELMAERRRIGKLESKEN